MASRNHSMPGFTVFQPAIGAALQFVPALGTPELDAMVDAYIAGPGSAQEKRAVVSVEFFNYSRQTGEASLFFPIFPRHADAALTGASPAADSGYGSGFTVSPVLNGPWAAASGAKAAKKTTSRKSASGSVASSSRAALAGGDFSHIPGMKIMTKDGVDVTNSASRGCKTKEQRDHAHLMRIIKACDACKKKKIRCDPSHKKRSGAPQAPAEQARHSAASKKAKAPAARVPAATSSGAATAAAASAAAASHFFGAISPDMLSFDMATAAGTPFAPSEELDFAAQADEIIDWEQFLDIPQDYNFFLDPRGLLTPSSGSAFSPAPSSAADPQILQQHQQPRLPYLIPDGHGDNNNYVDFTLYSPASSFLDEEPQQLQTPTSPSAQFDASSYAHTGGWASPSQLLDHLAWDEDSPAAGEAVAHPVSPWVPRGSALQASIESQFFDPGSLQRPGAVIRGNRSVPAVGRGVTRHLQQSSTPQLGEVESTPAGAVNAGGCLKASRDWLPPRLPPQQRAGGRGESAFSSSSNVGSGAASDAPHGNSLFRTNNQSTTHAQASWSGDSSGIVTAASSAFATARAQQTVVASATPVEDWLQTQRSPARRRHVDVKLGGVLCLRNPDDGGPGAVLQTGTGREDHFRDHLRDLHEVKHRQALFRDGLMSLHREDVPKRDITPNSAALSQPVAQDGEDCHRRPVASPSPRPMAVNLVRAHPSHPTRQVQEALHSAPRPHRQQQSTSLPASAGVVAAAVLCVVPGLVSVLTGSSSSSHLRMMQQQQQQQQQQQDLHNLLLSAIVTFVLSLFPLAVRRSSSRLPSAPAPPTSKPADLRSIISRQASPRSLLSWPTSLLHV